MGRQDYDSHRTVETEEDQSKNRANRLLALVKSRLFNEKPSHLLASQKVDNLLPDFFKEDREYRDKRRV